MNEIDYFQHPAYLLGQFIGYYLEFGYDRLDDMLEVPHGSTYLLLQGYLKPFTEDKLFILPYVNNWKEDNINLYNKMLAEALKAERLTLKEVFKHKSSNLTILIGPNDQEVYPTPAQLEKIIGILFDEDNSNS